MNKKKTISDIRKFITNAQKYLPEAVKKSGCSYFSKTGNEC